MARSTRSSGGCDTEIPLSLLYCLFLMCKLQGPSGVIGSPGKSGVQGPPGNTGSQESDMMTSVCFGFL